MGDLAAFTEARLDDTEAWANARLEGLPHEYAGDLTPEQALAMHVLATVKAHRAILAEHEPRTCHQGPLTGQQICDAESPYDDEYTATAWPCPTALALAAIWDDHPDYADAVGGGR